MYRMLLLRRHLHWHPLIHIPPANFAQHCNLPTIPFSHTTPNLSLSTSAAPTAAKVGAIPTKDETTPQPRSRNSNKKSAEIPVEKLFISPGLERSDVKPKMLLSGSNIVLGPYAGDSKIKQAEFAGSSIRAKDCPKDRKPEIALLGRSNVGKSSLINCLVRKKELAMTSKTPGKTQLINHFLINNSWYIVDLPGYGYAYAPESVRIDWNTFTKGFFLNRDTLVAVLLLIDASVPPQKSDLDCANWLARNDIPLTFVFTKCDKRKSGKKGLKPPEGNIQDFQNLIREYYRDPPPWIMTSSVTNLGRDELLLHMSQLRNYWNN